MNARTTFGWVGLATALRLSACGDSGLVAHEWGTFTSVQGADGVQMQWNPFIRTDLPSFVYTRSTALAQGWKLPDSAGKDVFPAIVRMETPVIYFYSSIPRTVDATVTFPGGRITEWYPQATGLGSLPSVPASGKSPTAGSIIEWKGVRVLPQWNTEISAADLLHESTGSHYYAARDTAANLLRVDSPHARKSPEYDRVLFYRGVGNSPAPLRVALGANENELQLSTTNGEPMSDLFVLAIHHGVARFQHLERLSPHESRTVAIPAGSLGPLPEERARLMKEMEAALNRSGLYAPEARAMVNTWKDQWFEEEGIRVLYLLPAPWTDRTLPLAITPHPARLVRVMVGRSEVIMPQSERELRRSIAKYTAGDAKARQQAVAEVRGLGLGRFIEPAVRRVLGALPARAVSDAAWSLVREATATEKPATVAGQAKPGQGGDRS